MRVGLAIIAAATASASAPAGARPGHVVRVERPLHRGSGTPRFCGMPAPNMGRYSYCFGAAPVPGDTIALLDLSHYLGSLRIAEVEPMAACRTGGVMWKVRVEGELTEQTDVAQAIGFIDVPLDPRRAHVVTPPKLPPDADLVVAVDGDGDGAIDVEFVIRPCDTNATTRCLELYTAPDGHELELAQRAVATEACF
jgi:hypothetical protein